MGIVDRVAAARLFRSTWRQLAAGWTNTPAVARRRWSVTLGAGLAGSLAVVAAFTILGERAAAAGLLGWEAGMMEWAQTGPQALSIHNAVWVDAFGSSAMLIPLVVLGVVLAAARGRPLVSLSFLVGFVGAKALIFLGWSMWPRPRPTGVVVPEALPSYPSGHVLQTIVIYGLLAYLWTRVSRSTTERIVAWSLAIVISALTGIARLRIGAHWPADVIVGGLFGLLWLAVVVLALRRAERAGATARRPDAARRVGYAPGAAARGD